MSPPFEDYLATGTMRGLTWTPLRREVLAFLWREQKPWGAHGIGRQIGWRGKTVHPNSVYRVLRELDGAGLIIPIVSLSRVLISPDPHREDWAVFICRTCRYPVLESVSALAGQLRDRVRASRFEVRRMVIECVGECRACAAATPGDASPADASVER